MALVRIVALLALLLASALATPEISVVVDRPFVVEGESDPVLFTFTRDNATAAVTVILDRSNSTALFGTDYTSSFGTATSFTMAAGVDSREVSISVSNDGADESVEVLAFGIVADAAYSINPDAGYARAFILDTTKSDNDIFIMADPEEVHEDGSSIATFYFLRSGDPLNSHTVTANVSGTATDGIHFLASVDLSGATVDVAISATTHSSAITIAPIDDDTVEADSTIELTLQAPSTTNPMDAAFYNRPNVGDPIITIIDDDPSLRLALSSPASGEVTEGAGDLTFTFTRTGPTGSAETVTFRVGGTATFGSTYSILGGASQVGMTDDFTIDIPSASSSVNVVIRPTDDMTFTEPSTTVSLAIVSSSPGGLFIDDTPVFGTIIDDDGFTVQITGPPLPSIPEDANSPLVVTLSRTPTTLSLASSLDVNLAISGTASIASGDYSMTGSDVMVLGATAVATIPAGLASSTIEVLPTPDSVVEPDETVILTVDPGLYIIGALDTVQLTITNDDRNTVSITITSLTDVGEDSGGRINVQLNRVAFDPSEVTVQFSVAGTADFGVDYIVETSGDSLSYIATSGSMVFPEGVTTTSFDIVPLADTDSESDETIIIALAPGANYAIGSPAQVTATILNDDPAEVNVVATPSEVREDNGADISFIFSRVGSTDSPLTISFTVGGTADLADYTTGEADWNIGASTVTIPAGHSQLVVIIDPVTDSNVEDDETVTVTLNPGTGYSIGEDSFAQSIIFNDDGPSVVRLIPGLISTFEDSAASLQIEFRRSGSPDHNLDVNFEVDAASTASSLDDYSISGTLSFDGTNGVIEIPQNEFSATLNILPIADIHREDDETIIINGLGGANYTIAAPPDDTATLTIENDDPTVSLILVNTPSQLESNALGFTFRFTRVNTTGELELLIELGGTATGDIDYEVATLSQAVTNGFPGSPTRITMADGLAALEWTLSIINDDTPEPDETIIVTLLDGAGDSYTANPVSNTATATITNDDGAFVSLSADVSQVTEGIPNVFSPTPRTIVTYTFVREGSLTSALTVGFDVSASTATFGVDYSESGANTFSSNFGTVIFPVGVDTVDVVLTITDDDVVEGTEVISIALIDGSGYTPRSTEAVVVSIISDDGNVVSVSVSPDSVLESAVPAEVMTFTFHRDGQTTDSIIVSFNIGGSAVFGQDYSVSGDRTFDGSDGTVEISRSSRTATIRITPLADAVDENDETITITVVEETDSEYVVDSTSPSATGVITEVPLNADFIHVAASASQIVDTDESVLLFTFTRVDITDAPLIIQFTVSGSAVRNIDYVATANSGDDLEYIDSPTIKSSITMSSGSRTVDVAIDPLDIQTSSVSLTIRLEDPDIAGSYVVDTPSSATITILDDESGVSPGSTFDFFGQGNLYHIQIRGLLPVLADRKRGVVLEGDELVDDNEVISVLADLMGISVSFFAASENYGDSVIISIVSVPGGQTATELAVDIVTAINARDPRLANTVLRFARAYDIGAELPITPEAIANNIGDFNINYLISDVVEQDYTYYYYYSNDAGRATALSFLSVLCIMLALW